MISGELLPSPILTSERYGVFGGETVPTLNKDKAIVNLSNPSGGIYTIAVRAGGTLPSSYAPASALLTVDILNPAPLNFSSELNEANGLSHSDSRSLSDKQKYIYRVSVPEQVAGSDILGWLVTLEKGAPIVRFFQSAQDFGKTPALMMNGRTALIVPPLLVPGSTWFIEVEGVGTTDYTLSSKAVTLSGEPWTLPTLFNQQAGDSNPGQPDGVGIGRDLAQDHWEFFALDVPENNLGLMRFALESSNGNPNVYIQHGSLPTTDHRSQGSGGDYLYQYQMIRTDSENANFSENSTPLDKANRLRPGRWYIGVKSDPIGSTRTSSRYRLKAHSGVVTDLDLNTNSPLTAQNLGEGDWRYYRVTIPQTGIPTSWLPSFTRSGGVANLYIRDTLPPFTSVRPGTSATTYTDWGSDVMNKVANTAYIKAPVPGVVTLPVPPLRPGKTYYLGFYGTTGGSFEVSSSTSSSQLQIHAEMSYNSGNSVFSIPAGQKRLIRFHVPTEATRIRFECLQSTTGLQVKLEQGAPPDLSAGVTAHLQSPSSYPALYKVNQPITGRWPFVSNENYYLMLSNTTAASIDTVVTMSGVDPSTEDEDADGIPDAWELKYFPSLAACNPLVDSDSDGSTNLQEFLNGTIPTNAQSVKFLISVSAPGGTYIITPRKNNYNRGETVTVTASPKPGDQFRAWESSAPVSSSGIITDTTQTTITFDVTGNLDLTAIFTIPIQKALDIPSSQAVGTFRTGSWYGQYRSNHDGRDAASSAETSSSKPSRMTLTLTGPGVLDFRWKVSSRLYSHTLALQLDGVTQGATISGTTMTAWEQRSLVIPEGTHIVSWLYSKNATLPDGLDRGWVDTVTYTGFPPPSDAYADWANSHFSSVEATDPSISGPTADPDNDGINNLLEAAFGTSPKTSNSGVGNLALTHISQIGNNRILSLECQIADSLPSDLRICVEASSDLSTDNWTKIAEKQGADDWTPHGFTTITSSPPVSARVPVLVEETITATTEPRFYRLKVTQSE